MAFVVCKVGNHDIAAVCLESSRDETSCILLRLRKELCIRKGVDDIASGVKEVELRSGSLATRLEKVWKS